MTLWCLYLLPILQTSLGRARRLVLSSAGGQTRVWEAENGKRR